jgi:diguanylate cyclase (GGDEF)-like protein
VNLQALPTVLVVDDDRVNRTLLAELLSNDCRVILARDGASALERVREEADIDLILLDISMPGMDGYETLRHLRADSRSADVAVIFITAAIEAGDEERGLLAGAMDYLFKPIRPAVVRARVRNHLKLVTQRKELERLAERDDLTGIANRRRFDQAFEFAWRRAARTGEVLGLAMIDVDHFKQYNDRYGHGAGDDALREIAEALASVARHPHDLAARYGGEEFVLLLPGSSDFEALLEELRSDIIALRLAHADSPTAAVITVSCGGVLAQVRDEYRPAALLDQADALLYEAKRLGRNRVCVQRCSSVRAALAQA